MLLHTFLLAGLLAGSSPAAASAPARDLVLRPGSGFEGLALGATEAEARAKLGEPQSIVNGRTWEYFDRCATIVFDDAGKAKSMSIGDASGLDEIAGRCENVVVEGGLRLRSTFEQARSAFPTGNERVVGAGKRGWGVPGTGTLLVFQQNQLHWVVTRLPRGGPHSESQGPK